MNKLLSLSLLATTALMAAPPAVGDKAPGFALKSVEGKDVSLSNFTGKGPIVLLMLRGYPGYQCPLCTRQVHDFLKSADDFKAAGAQVVMVYPGAVDRAEEFLRDKPLPSHFTLLLDPEYRFTNLYNLRWDAPKETAYPSTFLLRKDGTIFYEKISNSHGDRTTAAQVLAELRK